MNNGEWVEWIVKLGSIAGAVTGVGKLLANIIKKVQEANSKRFEKALQPFIESLNNLNKMLEDSVKDRELLHSITGSNKDKLCEHETIIDSHEVKITALESWREEHNIRMNRKSKEE